MKKISRGASVIVAAFAAIALAPTAASASDAGPLSDAEATIAAVVPEALDTAVAAEPGDDLSFESASEDNDAAVELPETTSGVIEL